MTYTDMELDELYDLLDELQESISDGDLEAASEIGRVCDAISYWDECMAA